MMRVTFGSLHVPLIHSTPPQVFLCYWRVFRMRENQKYKRVKDELETIAHKDDAAKPVGEPAKKGYDWKYVLVVVHRYE